MTDTNTVLTNYKREKILNTSRIKTKNLLRKNSKKQIN